MQEIKIVDVDVPFGNLFVFSLKLFGAIVSVSVMLALFVLLAFMAVSGLDFLAAV